MAALFASFFTLFVLSSAVEAATCAPEAATAHAAEMVSEPDSAGGENERSDQHAICSHGHCHHGGAATAPGPDPLNTTAIDRDIGPVRPANRLTSRAPTGPDRPPRV